MSSQLAAAIFQWVGIIAVLLWFAWSTRPRGPRAKDRFQRKYEEYQASRAAAPKGTTT